MSEPLKHHYLPVFYLKAWSNADSNLCEFSRPYSKVSTKWKNPAATGYVQGLYTLPGVPASRAQLIEKRYMGFVDTAAARVHQVMLAHGTSAFRTITAEERVAWARFLYSLTFRNPERVNDINKQYAEHAPGAAEEIREQYRLRRKATDPETFDEFKVRFLANPYNTSGLNVLPRLLRSKSVIVSIAQMTFWTIKLPHFSGRTFLTSDRPIIMTNGLNKPDAHIVIPISPDVLFLAGRNTQAYDFLASLDGAKLVRVVNEKVAEQSHRFIYGNDASQLHFVTKRIGKKVKSTPLG